MYRKYYILFLVAILVAFLYGCQSHNTVLEDDSNGSYMTTRLSGEVDSDGRLSPIVFNSTSGAKIEAKEAGTMRKGVKVNVEERKTSEIGLNPLGCPAYLYVYKITAALETTDTLGNTVSVPVYSLEKPLTLTLSTEHLGTKGLCYTGIRKSDSKPWKYTRLLEPGTSELNLRAALDDALLSQYSFDLYTPCVEVALFVYVPESDTKSETTFVDSLTASNTPVVANKNGYYCEDLKVDLTLDGLNLDKLNSNDLKVVVTYKNRRKNITPIKANNTNCSYDESISRSDEAVNGGGTYVHSIIVNNLPPAVLFAEKSIYSFILNLSDTSLDEFPLDFTVEISSVSKDEKQIPFCYSKHLSFETKKDEPPLISYKIAYNLEGGKLSKTNPETYDVTSATIILNNPIKEGYDFIGWTGSNGDTPKITVIIEQGSTGNLEYTANYAPKPVPPTVYTITYKNIEGCIIDPDNPTNYDTTSATITLTNPEKEGYTFIGWTGTGIEGEASTTVKIRRGSIGNREYTANFIPDDYTITYELNGGKILADNPTVYNITFADIVLNNPIKDGYIFIGWSGTGLAEMTTKLTIPRGSIGNRKYTANFMVESYHITYNIDGGCVAKANPESYDITSATITLNNPTKEGYTFLGWTGTDIAELTSTVTIPTGSTGPREYTASFTPDSYTISYELDGGSIATPNPENYDITSDTITLTNPEKEGYDFIGWTGTDIAELSTTVRIEQGSTGNRVYTASYTLISYIISYLGIEDSTVDPNNPTSYDITSDTIILNNPTKDGYSFLGWTLSDTDKPTRNMIIAQGSTGNMEFTAHWMELTDVMIFTLADGVNLELRRIPAGSFKRSARTISGAYCGDDLTVNISEAFYMGTFEVTQAQYNAVMHSNPSYFQGGYLPSSLSSSDNLPVEQVSYNDICDSGTGFLAKINALLEEQLPIGYRFNLPTEAQWEYACRGGTTTDLNSGKSIDNDWSDDSNANEVAWNYYNSGNRPHVVGTAGTSALTPGAGTASNSFGLYDMHGNNWEWCYDWYETPYDRNNLTDPVGPANGTCRVVRGGGWDNPNTYLLSSWYRSYDLPTTSNHHLGFRLVLTPVR